MIAYGPPYNERERHSGTFFIKSTSYCVNYLKCLLVMLIYFYSAGCWSYVGRTGNSQVINLGSAGCWTQGIVAHEIGKLFGLVSVYSFFFYYYYYYFPYVLSLSFCLLGVFTGCFSCCFSYTFFPFFVKICFYFYLYIF